MSRLASFRQKCHKNVTNVSLCGCHKGDIHMKRGGGGSAGVGESHYLDTENVQWPRG